MNICVYGAASDTIDKAFIKAGEALGKEMAKRGHGLVFGAGASGMMGALARGMTANGGHIVGIAPRFFNADGVLYDKCGELIRPETMRERKAMLENLSDAFIVTPGGVGTLDEFFEILTLKQLGRLDKPVVILNMNGFYDGLLALIDDLTEKNFAADVVKTRFFVTDSVKKALNYVEKAV